MKRRAIVGAVFGLLVTSAAFAQDDTTAASPDAPPPPVAQSIPDSVISAPDQGLPGHGGIGDAGQLPTDAVATGRPPQAQGEAVQGATAETAADQDGTGDSAKISGQMVPAPMDAEQGGEHGRGWVWHRWGDHDAPGGMRAEHGASGPGGSWGGAHGRFGGGPAGPLHPPRGAFFRLSRGDGGPSIMIKCADSDSTQECVDAITPILERAMRNR